MGSIIDFQKEISLKREYNPPAEIKQYSDAQKKEYMFDVEQQAKQYKAFNDISFLDYYTRAQEDTFKYVPPPVDPTDWRNFIRSGDERNKLDSLLSFIVDLNFQSEPIARDWLGSVNEDMGEVAEAFIRYLNILDETSVKDPWTDLSMFSVGTVFKQIKYVNKKGMDKIAKDWNPDSSIEDYSYDTRLVDISELVESRVLKPNRLLLSDVAEPQIHKQDHIWIDEVVPYPIAYRMFSTWQQWQFVKPYNPSTDQWTDVQTDTETEQKTNNDKVRIRCRESEVTNELSIYCNDVLMTPVGLKLPEGCYSVIMQQAAVLDPHFAYGRSFMDNVRPFVGVKDVLTSVLVDKSRQSMEPPLKSRFRTMVNRYMFKPGAVTPMQGDGDLTPLIPASAMDNFVFEALKVYEEMINKASISPVFQGQDAGGGQMTKYEVQQMLAQSIRSVAGMVAASIAWRKQEAQLKLQIGLNHFSKITDFKFENVGDVGVMGKSVNFGAIPTTQKKYIKAISELSNAQNLLKKKGQKKKFYIADPTALKDYSFVIDFRVNSNQRDSKAADDAERKAKIDSYRVDPVNIDQRAVSRMLIRENNDDEDELLAKEQPQGQQMPPNAPPNAMQSPQTMQAQSAPQDQLQPQA